MGGGLDPPPPPPPPPPPLGSAGRSSTTSQFSSIYNEKDDDVIRNSLARGADLSTVFVFFRPPFLKPLIESRSALLMPWSVQDTIETWEKWWWNLQRRLVVSRQVLAVEEALHQKMSVSSFLLRHINSYPYITFSYFKKDTNTIDRCLYLLASAVVAVQEEVAAVVLPTLHYRLEKKAAVEVQSHLLLKACRAAAL